MASFFEVMDFAGRWLATTARLYANIPWIRLNSALVEATRACCRRRKGAAEHSILVVGDGFAEGLGDWVVAGQPAGLPRHLPLALAKGDQPPLQSWTVSSYGHIMSTSAEWDPDCKRKPRKLACTASKSLFADLVASPRFKEADIVVLLVGSMDGARHSTVPSTQSTAEFVQAIAEALSELGKRVVVCEVPPSAPAGVPRSGLIALAVERLRTAGHPVRLGPRTASQRWRQPEFYCWDGLHFSSAGYRRLAEQLAPVLAPLVRQVEAATVSAAATAGAQVEAATVSAAATAGAQVEAATVSAAAAATAGADQQGR